MRTSLAVGIVLSLAGVRIAAADTFNGFSGVDRPYLVNSDRVCAPLTIANGTASGVPKCEKQGADVIARLDIKASVAQSGAHAAFVASGSGRTLTVARKTGEPIVTWDAPDPVLKVVDVFASKYEDRIAIAYTTRSLGKETTAVVAFDLGQNQTKIAPQNPITPQTPSNTPPTPPEDPKLTKAADAARKQTGAKAIAAWQAVQAIDAESSEARYRIAAAQALTKQQPAALATLDTLAKSTRGDAIEWLVEARFDPAFTTLRADAAYRKLVGLDRKATTPYERLMGFGGKWEQTGTSCDKAEVRFVAARDRSFKLSVKTACEGKGFEIPFKGNWAIEGDNLVLTVPTRGKQVSDEDKLACRFETHGDEDQVHCTIGHDLEFTMLPTRR